MSYVAAQYCVLPGGGGGGSASKVEARQIQESPEAQLYIVHCTFSVVCPRTHVECVINHKGREGGGGVERCSQAEKVGPAEQTSLSPTHA